MPSHRREEPNDAAIAPDGSVFGSDQDNHHIVHFDANGVVFNTVGAFGTGPGQLVQPWGLAVDAAGNLNVADYASKELADEMLNADGTRDTAPNCERRSTRR